MSPSLIFITGSTGFIGSHVVTQTLEAGHHVRLSVRRESQIDDLKKRFSAHAEKLNFVVVPNLAEPGAFNEPLRDVDYVFHIASPMPGKGSDFKRDYLGPAQQGTISFLDAAKSVPTIKRVIIVSSFLALLPLDVFATGNFVAKEGDNQSIPADPDMEFPSDPFANAGAKYQASKILAHRAVLEWVPKNAPKFSVITLHPSFVFGRNLTQTSPDGIDGTNAMLWQSLYSDKPTVAMAAVDVRDVALAHLRALTVNVDGQSGVQEFLLSAPEAAGWTWERVIRFLNEKYPDLKVQLKGPFVETPKPEAKRATELLGIRWRSMEDTISSFVDHQFELKSRL